MAFLIKLAVRIKRTRSLLFPLILHPILHPTPSSFSRPINYSSASSKSYLHNDPFSLLESSPNQYYDETSDFEDNGLEAFDSEESDLNGFLELLFQTKQFSFEEDSMTFLEASGVRLTRDLVYAALWELRNDWKSAFLAFNWAQKCVSESLRAWNLMIWTLGKQRKFDTAWRLVREMHQSAMVTRQALHCLYMSPLRKLSIAETLLMMNSPNGSNSNDGQLMSHGRAMANSSLARITADLELVQARLDLMNMELASLRTDLGLMAFLIKLAIRIKRTRSLLCPLILHPNLHPTSSSFSPPINYSSASSKSHLHNDPFSLLESSPNQYYYETSDFEDNGLEAFDSEESDLNGFLELLSQTKQFSSEEDPMTFLEGSGIRPTRGLVYAALWELRNDWKLAFLAFNWAQKCVSESPSAWNLMIWILGKQRKFDMAWRLVREMHQSAMVTRQALLIMIKRYAAANDATKAIRTFHAMEKFKITGDLTSFYTLLRALCKHRNIEEAEELMFLNKKLFPLETESFNIILNGWCNIILDVIEAKRIWREMSNCCITPDGTSYTHMICCFSKVGDLFDSLRLYDEMKKKGWVPGLLVYNSLIYVLAKENCVKESHNLLSKIIEMGLQPDAATYNSIIYPLCEANKLDEAWDALHDMIEKGLDPTIGTYHAFAKVENMGGTLKLINRMREVGCDPNSYTFLLIFNKFFGWGQPGYVLKMWTEMKNHNAVPDSEHYIVLVEGLARCGWLNKAREFYYEMKSKGFSDDPKLEKLLKGPETINKNYKGGQGRHNEGGIHVQCGQGNCSGMNTSRAIKEADSILLPKTEHEQSPSVNTGIKRPASRNRNWKNDKASRIGKEVRSCK
ncbi:tetratricopeptide repeat (TPR)-like superfamily protein [Tasmannia lanceolata]|uniref:tetratricopeptide repeat (TPR)-like superfamily protein n=1 Tax=Tasmannia lanceolata TaxID=3420 RepID=UPI004064555C